MENSVPQKQFSDLQLLRHSFVPTTPACIADVNNTKISMRKEQFPIDEGLKPLFPTLLAKEMPYHEIFVDNENGQVLKQDKPLRIGCVLSGGQAAGGHNVIMGLFDMVKSLHPDSKLFGFLAGPHGIFSNNYMEIDAAYMKLYRNMGGFDMIRSGRHKIETPEQFEASLKNATDLQLDGLVVIGGDDSNTNACLLAEYFAKNNAHCKVIGCPKTIDGDLQNEHIPVSFGFDTATKVYSEAIGNLCSDAVSSKNYYYFIRLMGRSASHIALECALKTRINLVLVGEEVKAKNMTLSSITKMMADIICKRSDLDKNYGVFLVPEGLIEFIPEMAVLISEINEILSKEVQGDIREHVSKHLTITSQALFNFLPWSISDQLLLDRDPHGNVQVSKIETEKLLILLLKQELKNRQNDGTYKGKFSPQSHFFGYEGRCALPSNFDSQYCYSLGLNAAVLIREGLSGYMSCVKNLHDRDSTKWVIAGCPLPAMMGVERRKGKDKPVITKALVKLDGGMFKAYEAVRDKWTYLDCYMSPGPIQFSGPACDSNNFMVQAPNIQQLIEETNRTEEIENKKKTLQDALYRDTSLLSELSQARIKDNSEIPQMLQKGSYACAGIKKYFPISELVRAKISEQYPNLRQSKPANYFVEIQDKLLTNQSFVHNDEVLDSLNQEMLRKAAKPQRIALLQLGRPAPGCNNIVDGLLRFAEQREGVQLFGFINGLKGMLEDKVVEMTKESFAPYKNLGGQDYLGRSEDVLRTPGHHEAAIKAAKKYDFDGIVVVGATHTMTDVSVLAEKFLENGVKTRLIHIPCTVDGNIHHKYIETSLGYDTASKVYSQLIGNMLTDSASAIKYWYFIRLMGAEPTHLAMECALKTQPNIVLVSEECAARNETLTDIVKRIADICEKRAAAGKNYGCVLIPEGLLSFVSAFKHLIAELNHVFKDGVSSMSELQKLAQDMYESEEITKQKLTPWSFSLYQTLPDFMKLQLLTERELEGSVKLSHIETEKLVAYLVDEELKKRKAAGTYKAAFAPVTHFFGYQGRCGHPSLFDCSLGSTYGFAAGVLLENGLNALTVTINSVNLSPSEWRVGGVPILSLLKSQPKSGFPSTQLVVNSEMVDLEGKPYQQLKSVQRSWIDVDQYKNPGPIQFYLQNQQHEVPIVINQLYNQTTNISEEIRGLCASIQNDCLFTEHQHLLYAALSSLKSAKQVINSMSNQMTD